MPDPSTRAAGGFRLTPVKLEVVPEPSEEERAAIAAALAEETVEPRSPWADAVLPNGKECEKP